MNADSEDPASLYAFERFFHVPWHALLDPGTPAGSYKQAGGAGPVTRAYGVGLYPTFYVIDPRGIVGLAKRPRTARHAALPEAARCGGKIGPASWVGFAIRLVAAAVWIIAGAVKIPQIQAFEVLVQRYGIFPVWLSGPFATVVPFLELAIGAYLAAGLFVRGTSLVGTLLFAAFLTAQASAWFRGISLDCGCFGTALQTAVGPLTILRDFGLGIPTFLMLAFPARALSLDRRLFGAAKQ